MASTLPCHEYCSELVEKQIRESMLKIQGSVTSLVRVQEIEDGLLDCPDAQVDSSGKRSQETFTHTFLMSVVVPCYQEKAESLGAEVRDSSNRTAISTTDDVMKDGEETDSGNASVDFAIHSFPTEFPKQGLSCDDLCNIQTLNIGESGKSGESGESIGLMGYLLDYDGMIMSNEDDGLYPLTTSELQHTIIQQLDKSHSPEHYSFPSLFKDVSNSCFIDDVSEKSTSVPCVDQTVLNTTISVNQVAFTQQQQQQHSPQQQQSNEISSSTWGAVATSTASCCQSATMFPQITFNEYYSDFPFSDDTQQANVAISSTKTQILCPANLPAASTLVSGGNGSASTWTLSRMSTTNTVNLNPRQTYRRQVAKGTSRPALLLPKTMLQVSKRAEDVETKPYSPGKGRSRKTNPTYKSSSSSNALQPTSQFTDTRPLGAPEGHTYQSYIITEGLVKVRQQMREDRKTQLNRKKKSNSSSADEEEEGTPISTSHVAVKEKKKQSYFCPICEKKYSSANGLKYHAMNGHGPKGTPFQCKYCEKEYASRHGLAGHEKTHETRTEKLETVNLQGNN